MSKPQTLLEGLCGHALSIGAGSIEVEYQDGRDWVYANQGNKGVFNRKLRPFKAAMAKICVKICMRRGRKGYEPAPGQDASQAPVFTAKQGQYPAFIYNYPKIHRRAPAEADFQKYFQVTPPSVHQMIRTLQLKRLIDATPGQARSIRLLVAPEHLPRLE
jgi:hypothetical protein